MSQHCDECDQGRRCTGACMQRDDTQPREPAGLIGMLFWLAAIALWAALIYFLFGG
jgi:hypothetical protein